MLMHESLIRYQGEFGRDLENYSPEGLLHLWGAGKDVVEAMRLFESFFKEWGIVFSLRWNSLNNVPTIMLVQLEKNMEARDGSVKMTTEGLYGLSFEPCFWLLDGNDVDLGLRDILLFLGKGFDTWRWDGAGPQPTSFIFVDGWYGDVVRSDVSRFGKTWEYVIKVPRYGSLEEMRMKMMLKGVS